MIHKDYSQQQWDEELISSLETLIRQAIREDSPDQRDLTSLALVPTEAKGRASLIVRQKGRSAGVGVIPLIAKQYPDSLFWEPLCEDGCDLLPGQKIGVLSGSARSLLVAERLVLNFLGHLCGIATLTSQFVEKTATTGAKIYDTRKTLPGWRLLEKYAVRCGGGQNHRMGLYDHILIKDNHLAFGALGEQRYFTPAGAVRKAKAFLVREGFDENNRPMIEIEVDNLEQLLEVLPEQPDIVLLDNMTNEQLREAVKIRNSIYRPTQLEASGGVTLATVEEIARTGVERISSGQLTHSVTNLDIGLDWG